MRKLTHKNGDGINYSNIFKMAFNFSTMELKKKTEVKLAMDRHSTLEETFLS